MSTKTTLRFASLTFLGSLAAVACGESNETPAASAVPVGTDSAAGSSTMTPVNPTAPSNAGTTTGSTGAGPATTPPKQGPPSPGTLTPAPATSTPPAVTSSERPALPPASTTSDDEPTAPDSTDTGMDMGSGGAGGAESDPDPDASGGADGTPAEPTLPAAGAGYPEDTGADCEVTAGELTENEMLPDPFAMHDGTRVSTLEGWTCRREEIKKDIEKYEIGTKPEPPIVEATLSGGNLNVVVTTADGSMTLTSKVGSGSGCVVIGMDGNSSMVNGCVQVPFTSSQVVYQSQTSDRKADDPFYEVYPELKPEGQTGKIGNYMAWSWGISRLIDGLDQVKDDLDIDMTKIAVHGCSYAGKMALFAGAFDERIALTIAQESGGGGITSWRTSQNFNDRTGTDVEKIDNTNYSWFMNSMKDLDAYSLPHDHHELIAMIAPRAVIALGNQDFDWLGDESGWKSMNAAKEVWKAMGAEANIGFDFTSNHGHCQAASSQTDSVNKFVDKFLKGEDTDTNVAIDPQEGNFDLDFSNVIDWETPTLQ